MLFRSGIAAQTWAVIMIAVASVVGLLMALTRKNVAYLLVLVWSFVGIAVKQAPAPGVVTAAWIGAGLMKRALPGLRKAER